MVNKKNFFSKEKVYYSTNEVSEITNIEPYVLRFWEKKFSKVLRPKKSRSGRRRYTTRDIEIVKMIVDLLYTKRFTIEGAIRELLIKYKNKKKNISSHDVSLKDIKRDLINLNKSLKNYLNNYKKIKKYYKKKQKKNILSDNTIQLTLFENKDT